MGEVTWIAVVIVAINMVGSVAITWLRYYYRAHYDVGDVGRFNGGRTAISGHHPQVTITNQEKGADDGGRPETESRP